MMFLAVALAITKLVFTPVVHRGHLAHIAFYVNPRSRCTITISPRKNPIVLSSVDTWHSWYWRTTDLGRFRVIVDCGKAGRRILTLRVIK